MVPPVVAPMVPPVVVAVLVSMAAAAVPPRCLARTGLPILGEQAVVPAHGRAAGLRSGRLVLLRIGLRRARP